MTDNDDRPLFASDKVTAPDFSFWNPQLGGFLVPQTLRDEIMSLALGTTMLGRVAAMSPEERAAAEQASRAALDAITKAHAELLADTADALAVAVLTLHAPQTHGNLVTCAGCDYAGYEGEPPEWPCRTYRLAAERNGRQFVGEYEPYGPRMEVQP
ncbi:MAG TPA: hypothetical protein VHX38_23935 [Pseudonocardiaceae bacterium]|nr:hypothetical protein [Pseudonocardiaceae bacterium]